MSNRLIYIFKKVGRSLNIVRRRQSRGHGIHTPFVYSLSQEVFKRRDKGRCGGELYEELKTQLNTRERTACELQKIYNHCGIKDYLIIDTLSREREHNYPESSITIVREPEIGAPPHLDSFIGADKKLLAVIEPHKNRERAKLCNKLIEENRCVTIDRFYYLLLIFNNKLTSQHFEL